MVFNPPYFSLAILIVLIRITVLPEVMISLDKKKTITTTYNIID